MSKLSRYGTFFIVFLLSTPTWAATSDCFPFVGEHYKYDVGWEFINAGTAEVNITQQGDNGYQVHNFARTNGFFDMFKKVRDTLVSEGICLGDKMQSTLFWTDQLEKGKHTKKRIEYLWQENKVKYQNNEKKLTFDVKAGHLSVLDAFYLTRLHPPTKDHPISIPVFDSEKKYDVIVKLLKHQKITGLDGKRIDCLVIQPELKTEGVFTSVGVIKIWLTNDARRIPLKITAKIKIGRIVVRLTEYSKT